MRSEKVIFVFALMLLMLCKIELSQAQEYAIRQFTVDDGLPSSHVYEVKQDSKGFYWIATSEGLVRYDGYKIEQVGEGNSPFNRDIWWSYEDSKGRIWGLSRGTRLWYFEADTFGYVDYNIDQSSIRVDLRKIGESTAFQKLIEDENGQFWLPIGGKLYGFNENEKKLILQFEFPSRQSAGAPNLLQLTNHSSYQIYKKPISVKRMDKNLNLIPIYSYSQRILSRDLKTNDPSVWNENNTTFICNTPDSLFTIHDHKIQGYFNGQQMDLGLFPSSDQLKENSYRVIKLNSSYAFLHGNGNFFTDKRFKHLPEFDIFEDLNINTIYQDFDNGLWVSTVDQGLIYLARESVAANNLSLNEKINSEVVAIQATDKGDIWIGLKNGTVYRKIGNELITRHLKPRKNVDRTWSLHDMLIVKDKVVFVVGDFEIHVDDCHRFSTESNEIIIDTWEAVKNINRGADNKLYIADYACSFSIDLSPDSLSKPMDLGGETILSTIRNSQGVLINSTYNGIYSDDGISSPKLLSKNIQARKFEFDSNKSIWVVHKSRGASKVGTDSITPIKDLSSYLVKDLFFEGDSVLWAATNRGLIQMQLDAFSDQFKYSRKLTTANGLPTNDVTAIHADRDNLYIGTSKGFTIIDRSKLTSGAIGTNVILRSIYSKGEKLSTTESLNLGPEQNALIFNYVYISAKSDGQINYQYRLKGIDQDWQETRETSITYPFLPAGDYNFQVKATDINGVPSVKNIDLNIRIQQYWWKTTAFLISLVLVGLLSTIVLFRVRLSQLKKREAERTDMNRRMAELKLNALQTQMNPHFVFNVLNSIQECFLAKQTIEANKYLSDFSKLMRLFLESSNDRNISLEKEVKLLTHYIELEQMRLKNKFDFEFRMEGNIEPDELFIPTMLLQPIVENAIIHGLKYKESKGHLLIHFSLDDHDILTIVINDDGVGRAKAEELNNKKKDGHVSMASSIITERIELINNNDTDRIDMKTSDLADTERMTGTRVELTMDLKINRNSNN